MPLVVYKSSAGSGKTTTLVNEYLKITLRNPREFKHVLAITFTNNAANEMKSRVLDALGKIIDGRAMDDGELKEVVAELALPGEELVGKAKELRKLIIHRYDEFAISTIDSFVHRIIRTFANDVQLPQNFEVVIDHDDFVPEIVDELFSRIGRDKALTDIMVNFVLSQAEAEKSYDPSAVITGFVEKQLGEEGFEFVEKISALDSATFSDIIKKIRQKTISLKQSIMNAGKEAMDLIGRHHLGPGDFYRGKQGIYNYFLQSAGLRNDAAPDPNSYVLKTVGEDCWTSGSVTPAAAEAVESIKHDLLEVYHKINRMAAEYSMFSIIYSKIYALALSGQIRAIFGAYSRRTQKVHISEFNKRISLTIAGQPVPFIFERLGRKYRYFLVDEFQDTSVLQWKNLFPLIEESLSYGHFNMLVGDAKQAIYRFRNGAVELFSNLPELYGFDDDPERVARQQVVKQHYREVLLDQNWRSREQIIEFNNAFFQLVKDGADGSVQDIYKEHVQKVPSTGNREGGYVSIDLLDTADVAEYDDKRRKRIRENVDMLVDNGYRMGDICLLTRTNKDATGAASFLLENGYPVITSESLLLSRSPHVRTLVALLRLLNTPDGNVHLADLLRHLILVRETGDFHELWIKASAALKSGFNRVMEVLDINMEEGSLAGLPVYEIVETALRGLGFNNAVNIYLQYFLDFVSESQESGKGTVTGFLEHWDAKWQKLYITMPEGGDAVRVMTIHKAKGLKFEAVIVDVVNRGGKSGRDEFYTNLDHEAVPELKVALLPMTKELTKIGLEEIYEQERTKTGIDFLNLVYVAFTRPVGSLMVIGHKGGKRADKFTQLLKTYLEAQGEWEQEGDLHFHLGELAPPKHKPEENKRDVLTMGAMISAPWQDRIRLADAEEVYWEAIDSKPARVYGNLLHDMLARIRYKEDAEQVIQQAIGSLVLDEEEAAGIREVVLQVVNHPQLSRLFDEEATVLSELDILDPDEKSAGFRRPDRVVLLPGKIIVAEYKTGIREEKHVRQITRYGALIGKMDPRPVEKLLVYINDTIDIIQV